MKISLLILSTLFFQLISFSQRTVEFRITTVSSDIGDMDGFGSGDSDPQWDASMSDGVNSSNFSHEQSGTNCPGVLTLNNTFFSRSYNCALPNSFAFQWRAFEDDGVGADANTGFQNVTINSSSLTATTFTTIATYSATASGTRCPSGGTVTWTITLQYRVIGSFLVNTPPSSINASSNLVLVGDNVTLDVVGGTTNIGAANFTWYSGSCNGTPIGTGNSITTTLLSPTTFFVNSVGVCSTNCASITIGTTALGAEVENFKHSCENEQLNISFSTINENNSNRFEVESLNETTLEWEKEIEIPSMGAHNLPNNYNASFVPSRSSKTTIFRLVEIDNNGGKTFYPVFHEDCFTNDIEISIYPSPNAGVFQVDNVEIDSDTFILDNLGRKVEFSYENSILTLKKPIKGTYYLIQNKNGKNKVIDFQVQP